MTIEERLKEKLVRRGMPPDQANRIIEKTKELESTKSMARRWQHKTEDYSALMLEALWSTVRKTALQDIDANTPKAFHRGLFE